MSALSLGYSPCPNDTFIFHALVHKIVDVGLDFQGPLLKDVETLNKWAFEGKLDVTKLSFHALGHVLDDYCILQAGSALGRGCGPLLVTADQVDLGRGAELRIAIPGKYTTASMLFQMFAPQCTTLLEMNFAQIMESVVAGKVDAGVVIHESRFTYQKLGLRCLQDLGEWWERISGLPIPLGCIAAKRTLGREKVKRIDGAIKSSLQYALANPLQSQAYIKHYSQEIDETVVDEHVRLYVNDFSIDLGGEGMQAITHFFERGRNLGILPPCNLSVTE